jgi:uncharacterized repeat protein (TIGR01451 family)
MKKLILKIGLWLCAPTLGFFFLFSPSSLLAQCGSPYVFNYDKKNTAFITKGMPFGSETEPILWSESGKIHTSGGLWDKCKGNSRFFDTNKYPQYKDGPAALNNMYIEIMEGAHLWADKMQAGNQLTLVVCGYLEVGDFETPDIQLSVIKIAEPKTFSQVNEVINYSIVVENNSDKYLEEVVITDATTGFLETINMAAFERRFLSTSYTITEADITSLYFENIVSVRYKPLVGAEIFNEYVETVFYSPLSITKTADMNSFDASNIGKRITYNITIKNFSAIPISDVYIEDNLYSGENFIQSWSETISSLLPYDPEIPSTAYTYTYEHEISDQDLTEPFLFNTVWATATGYADVTASVYVNNLSFEEEKLDIKSVDGDLFISSKADPQNNTVFNQVNIIICESGILVMDKLTAMNNVKIINDGIFLINSIQGMQANLCINGIGTVYNADTWEVVLHDGILYQDIIEGNWMTGENCDEVLPIELLSFTPEVKPDRIDLLWTTGTEINNDYFTLERSRDMYGWDILGFVQGAGNSSIPLNYTFSDLQPLDGLAYYRLKQTDFDGKFEYFGPIAAHYDLGMEGLDFKVLKQYTNWVIAVPNDGIYQVEVYNLMGHRLVSERTENTLTIPAPEGGVVIRVTDGYARSASRVVM